MLDQLELFPLSLEEVAQRSKALAALVAELDQVEAQKKQAQRNYTESLKQIRANITRLSQVVSHEQEWRDPYGRAAQALEAEPSV